MEKFMNPESVVLIGVTHKNGPGSYNNLETMLKYGYKGKFFLVHPHVDSIMGYKAYDSVENIPETPDLAIISVGRDNVLAVFKACVKKNIKRIIIISQGFKDADEKGARLQDEITAIAKKNYVRVLGPNTLGVLNPFSGFSTSFVDLKRDPAPYPLGAILQSGIFIASIDAFTKELGKALDIGNASDVDFVDGLEYFENDPETKIIFIYMEGVKNGKQFFKVASRVAQKKPIIILKTGRSQAGGQAALSHTGSIVGKDAVFDVAMKKAGLIRVKNMIELRSVCNALLHCPPMRGPRLGLITISGACGIMTADACEDFGLELASFPEDLLAQFEQPSIKWFKVHHPIDIWPVGIVSGNVREMYVKMATALLKTDYLDALMIIFPAFDSPLHSEMDAALVIDKIINQNPNQLPIVFWIYGHGAQAKIQELSKIDGVAVFAKIDEAVMGLGGSWRYIKYQN